MVTGKRPKTQFKKVRQVWGGNIYHSFQERLEKTIRQIDQKKYEQILSQEITNEIGRLWEGF